MRTNPVFGVQVDPCRVAPEPRVPVWEAPAVFVSVCPPAVFSNDHRRTGVGV